MRRPLRKAGLWSFLGVVGASGFLLAVFRYDELGPIVGTIALICGAALLPFSIVMLPLSLLAATGHARLLSGVGVIARWRLTPEEWDRFRVFDDARSAQHVALLNEMNTRPPTPADGVEVMFGRRQVIIDSSYHQLRPLGLPELHAVGWLGGPADPECLEFSLVYPAGRFGGAKRFALRVPVPPAAREAGVGVYWHFHKLIPQRRPGLAYRRPALVIGGCLTVALAAAMAGGVGWRVRSGGDRSDATELLMVGGFATAAATLFVLMMVVMITRPWTR